MDLVFRYFCRWIGSDGNYRIICAAGQKWVEAEGRLVCAGWCSNSYCFSNSLLIGGVLQKEQIAAIISVANEKYAQNILKACQRMHTPIWLTASARRSLPLPAANRSHLFSFCFFAFCWPDHSYALPDHRVCNPPIRVGVAVHRVACHLPTT